MSIEPEKFFVGLMDFFAILLPGALATFLIMDDVGQMVIGDRFNSLKGPEGWAAFFIASYLSGHVIFLLGSWLDEFYDRLRRQSLNRQIARLARRGRLLPWPARALVWIIFKGERDVAVDRASRLKRHSLGSIDAASAVNTFQWSKALLTLESPASLAVVQRFEADSKFFRSFAVLLLALAVTWPLHRRWPLDQRWPAWGIVVVIALLLLALLRYMEQRYKATNQAYWSVITLIARTGTVTIEKAPAADGAPTHAGGVVFRRRRGVLEFLLVEATNEPSVWVCPRATSNRRRTNAKQPCAKCTKRQASGRGSSTLSAPCRTPWTGGSSPFSSFSWNRWHEDGGATATAATSGCLKTKRARRQVIPRRASSCFRRSSG
jgi:hypothetical protein